MKVTHYLPTGHTGIIYYAKDTKDWVVKGDGPLDYIHIKQPVQVGDDYLGKKVLSVNVEGTNWKIEIL